MPEQSPARGDYARRARKPYSPFRMAMRCCARYPARLIVMLLKQALTRLIALSPLIYYCAGGVYPPPLDRASLILSLGLTLLLYLILVFPMRFYAAFWMKRLLFSTRLDERFPRACYGALVLSGAARLFSGLLWGAPFIALSYRLYQYIFVFDGTRFNRDFAAVGGFLRASLDTGARAALGTYVFFAALFLAALLFVYGWRRGVPFDFMPVYRDGVRAGRQRARKIRRKGRALLFKTSLINLLICLPSLIVLPLIPYLSLRPMLTGKAMNDLQLAYALVKAGMLSGGALSWTLAAFLVLYLPFILLRKLCSAAAVVLTDER